MKEKCHMYSLEKIDSNGPERLENMKHVACTNEVSGFIIAPISEEMVPACDMHMKHQEMVMKQAGF